METPSKIPYVTFIPSPCQNCRVAESQNVLGRIAECLEFTVLARIAECLEIKNSFSCFVDFIVNQICRFTSTMKKKNSRNLTMAYHRHPTEKDMEEEEEGGGR